MTISETTREETIPTQPSGAQTPTRLPRAHVHGWWTACVGAPPRQGPQEALGIGFDAALGDGRPGWRRSDMQLITIKRRAHFLRVRGGARHACASFALETKPRPPGELDREARFGFTVTKKLGNAVVRNRIKRRLREAVRHSASPYSLPDHDYVLIAREATLRRSFADLVVDLQTALQRVHAKGPPKPRQPSADPGRVGKPSRQKASIADAPTRPPKQPTPASD